MRITCRGRRCSAQGPRAMRRRCQRNPETRAPLAGRHALHAYCRTILRPRLEKIAPILALLRHTGAPRLHSDPQRDVPRPLRYARVWPKAYTTPARTKSIAARITGRHISHPRPPPRGCLSPKDRAFALQNKSGRDSLRRNWNYGSRDAKYFYDTPDLSGMTA